MNEEARTLYLRKFFTHEAGRGGVGTVEAIERALARLPRGARPGVGLCVDSTDVEPS